MNRVLFSVIVQNRNGEIWDAIDALFVLFPALQSMQAEYTFSYRWTLKTHQSKFFSQCSLAFSIQSEVTPKDLPAAVLSYVRGAKRPSLMRVFKSSRSESGKATVKALGLRAPLNMVVHKGSTLLELQRHMPIGPSFKGCACHGALRVRVVPHQPQSCNP